MNILMHVDIDKSHVNMIILHACMSSDTGVSEKL